MYGTTYDTIQNRYRKIRAEAEQLKKEVESGERPEVATPKKGGKSATATPRKGAGKKDALSSMLPLCYLLLWSITDGFAAVTNGRVSKVSPTKKPTAVKKEKKD